MDVNTGPEVAGRSLTDRLSRRYFLVTLAVFIVIGIPAYFFLARQVKRQFVSNYSEFALSTARLVFTGYLRHVDGQALAEPLTGTPLADFRAEVDGGLNGAGLLDVRVWRPDGMLVYSHDGQGIGRFRELNGGFAKAIKMGPLSEITNFVAEVRGQDVEGDALEIYLPVYRSDGSLANVFELYYSLDPLNSALASMRLTLITVLAVLFLAVAAIAQLGGRLLIRRNRQLAAMAERLTELAETDGLTGAYNHRHFHRELNREVEAATRYGRRASLIMADIDFFKRVNDTHGHQAGDAVLHEVAATMRATLRSSDTLARYGGEEFAILLPEASEREGVRTAERLRAAVAATVVPAGDAQITVTASFGVAELPAAALDAKSLVAAADSALYFAKRNGRNQVCAFSMLEPGKAARIGVDDLFARLQNASVFTVQALAAAVMGRSPDFEQHAGSVEIARLAAGALDLPRADAESLVLAASVYDVGKLTIPGGILAKRDALTPEEAEAIRQHPEASEHILSAIGDLERILSVVRHHHEHYDGSGYPEGLKGDQIPYLARVLLVIDAFTAMTSSRPYREAMTPDEAVAELRKHAGTQFDPQVVEKLAAALSDPRTGRVSAA